MTAPKINLEKGMADGLVIHQHFRKQEMIITTVDRLRICLAESRRQSASLIAWIAPVGIFVSLLAVIVAADFKDALGLRKDQWSNLFMVAIGMVGVWLVWAVIQGVRGARLAYKTGCLDLDEAVISRLRSQSEQFKNELEGGESEGDTKS